MTTRAHPTNASVALQIAQLLRAVGPLTPVQVADELGVTEWVTRCELRELTRRGILEHRPWGRYGAVAA